MTLTLRKPPAARAELDFELPPELEATAPPEARGVARDEVRLMVTHPDRPESDHARFRDLPRFLNPGDVLVVNESGTLNAALSTRRTKSGERLSLHFSTMKEPGLWIVELRRPAGRATEPFRDVEPGDLYDLPAGGRARIIQAFSPTPRLWLARVSIPEPDVDYLMRYGSPIRYRYVPRDWPSSYYQTIFAKVPGSAEMPSAGRPFTKRLVGALKKRGVDIAPVLLHTGVASLEKDEPPYEEYFRVSSETADRVNQARRKGNKIVAVGTTALRALETCLDDRGLARARYGWTDFVLSPDRGGRSADALITGFHEPRSSHLQILFALAGCRAVGASYREGLARGYMWHEFGDMQLLFGGQAATDSQESVHSSR